MLTKSIRQVPKTKFNKRDNVIIKFLAMDVKITDQEMHQFENELSGAIKVVSKHWPLSKFKRFVSQFLTTTNNEEQWTFDYESYALAMYRTKVMIMQLHPMHWAPEYYQERWDYNKFKKSIESLRKIASGEAKI